MWTPSPEQIQKLDRLLGPVIAESLAADGKPFPKDTSVLRGAIHIAVPDYYRQYVGIGPKDHPLIFINGFHKSFFDLIRLTDSLDRTSGRQPRHFDWRTNAVQVCDGGVGFFAAIYDPATKTLLQFAFNGEG